MYNLHVNYFLSRIITITKKTGLEYLFVGHGEYEIQRGISELLPARKRNFKVTQMQES